MIFREAKSIKLQWQNNKASSPLWERWWIKRSFRETNLAHSHRRWFLKLRPVKVSRLQRHVFWERNKEARAGHVGMGHLWKPTLLSWTIIIRLISAHVYHCSNSHQTNLTLTQVVRAPLFVSLMSWRWFGVFLDAYRRRIWVG